MNYGIPYMGSKSTICKQVCSVFPKAENFYDLFGGGFSVSHYMIKHRFKDFKYFHYNEIRKGVPELVKKAINGEFNYNVFKPKWVSREEFFKKKEIDPYYKIIWSFGNNGKDYIFGEDIEEYKKQMHNCIVFGEFTELSKKILGFDKWKTDNINERRLFLRYRIEYFRKNKIPDFLKKYLNKKQLKQLEQLKQLQQLERIQQLQQLQQLEQLERIQQLQQLQQLQRLERLEQLQQLRQLEQLQRLNFYNGSYKDVEIKQNSIIYCDPPYQNTAKYDSNINFNHKDFLDWAHNQKCPVYISEYEINDERFKLVKVISKRSMLSGNKDKCKNKVEKIYVNRSSQKT